LIIMRIFGQPASDFQAGGVMRWRRIRGDPSIGGRFLLTKDNPLSVAMHLANSAPPPSSSAGPGTPAPIHGAVQKNDS
jgi:hypothetical protein